MLRTLLFFLASVTLAHAAESADVLVYGATAGGVMAAVSAARNGMRVILLEPGSHVGGMVSGGLSNSDVDNQQQLIGGLAREFFERTGRHYGKPIAWAFEPHVAEQILLEMLDNAHVRLLLHGRLRDVRKSGSQIVAIRTGDDREFHALIFIDSSYEGDLMKAAGVSYVIGREGRSQYGESLAGRQDLLPGHHQFKYAVSADDAAGNLLPFVTPQEKTANIGEADGKFQSYCFRLCLTDRSENFLPIERPVNYNRNAYELARHYLESAKGTLGLNDFLGVIDIPNGKKDVNSTGPVSTDLLGANWEYPEASDIRRQEIWDEHLHWAQGLIYFLQNDPSVPERLQAAARRLGLPKDEFVDTGHWPHQLYIREGRRMTGEYFLTQHDLQEWRSKYDSVGMAGYNIDIREVQWVAHKVYMFPNVGDQAFTEGYLSMPVQPWEIPFRSLLPKQGQCSNLLVTACISASTVAYASFRMEANYMIAGHSAGTAAALAIKSGRSIHQVDLADLQSRLRQEKQILSVSER